MRPIIEVKNVWKSYKIGSRQERYLSLRDSIAGIGKNLFGQKQKKIWALENVSFDVMPGECVGIIGRNGAGKSTMLKILSRITPPTKGRITMRGRVASLLEVGTGFHPELTGRENVYLNGSILGMKRSEINDQFDQIVDFSGVEQFLDTPLKHFSSGMQLRLAFAVAAHLNPEILLIDEVLAVGDTEFQKKCIGKMDEVSKSGRTVIFVSHDLRAVKQLCKRTLLIQDHKVEMDDSSNEVINFYLDQGTMMNHSNIFKPKNDKRNSTIFKFSEIIFSNRDEADMICSGKNLYIQIKYETSLKIGCSLVLSVFFKTINDTFLFACRSDVIDYQILIGKRKEEYTCVIPRLPLKEGLYSFGVIAFNNSGSLNEIGTVGQIVVNGGDFYGTMKEPATGKPGLLVDYYFTN